MYFSNRLKIFINGFSTTPEIWEQIEKLKHLQQGWSLYLVIGPCFKLDYGPIVISGLMLTLTQHESMKAIQAC